MPRFYPIHFDISERLCVVVGGGGVAERKVAGLLEAGARIRLISPEATPMLESLADQGRIEHIARAYESQDIDGSHLVFAATNVRSVNARVAADAGKAGIPVNVADAPDEGTFTVPATVRRGDFCLSISTGGNNPMLAARIAAEMEERFGPEYADYVELLGTVRYTIKEWTARPAMRRIALAAVLDHEAEVRSLLAAQRSGDALALALSAAETAIGPQDSPAPRAQE